MVRKVEFVAAAKFFVIGKFVSSYFAAVGVRDFQFESFVLASLAPVNAGFRVERIEVYGQPGGRDRSRDRNVILRFDGFAVDRGGNRVLADGLRNVTETISLARLFAVDVPHDYRVGAVGNAGNRVVHGGNRAVGLLGRAGNEFDFG